MKTTEDDEELDDPFENLDMGLQEDPVAQYEQQVMSWVKVFGPHSSDSDIIKASNELVIVIPIVNTL